MGAFEMWKAERMAWHRALGLSESRLHFHQHTPAELAHYARAAFDIQFYFGGTLGFPGSAWDRGEEEAPPPAAGRWTFLKEPARHGFSHFSLTLRVGVARLSVTAKPLVGEWVAAEAFDPGNLPTAMRRVWEVAMGSPLSS